MRRALLLLAALLLGTAAAQEVGRHGGGMPAAAVPPLSPRAWPPVCAKAHARLLLLLCGCAAPIPLLPLLRRLC